ncbi:hypothetical protein [Streptomyces sp. IMTB 2501]|uniref:hypothetical protein n=1 Tax=Streptomyces sp. IMTB 2501 TaxID=1776340 RepID=UPI002115D6AD|nr:hypothetical protein [Streptomyces sp. IMTB 2501]
MERREQQLGVPLVGAGGMARGHGLVAGFGGGHQEIPPHRTYIDTGSVEVFRDEILTYARRLSEAGVSVDLHMWGVPSTRST